MSLESLNGIEYLSNHLKFKVTGYREKGDGNLYYHIIILNTLPEPCKREDLEYTYDTCLALQTALNSQCPDLPKLPGVGMFGFKPIGSEQDKRRMDLEKWLGAIVWRSDVLASREFQNFCGLKKLIDHNWLTQPRPSIVLQTNHHFPVVDFHYSSDTQVLFVLTSDDSIAGKMQSFMGIFGQTKTAPHSQLLCYRLDVDDDGEPLIKLMWEASYQQKATVLQWDENLTILAIGFDNGSIKCLNIATQKKYEEHSEYCEIRKHISAVSGIAFNRLTGYIYSIGKDKSLITTDLGNPGAILKEREFINELTCLITNQYRLFVGDSQGSVFIFNYQNGPLDAVHQIRQDIKMDITSLQFCEEKNFLIISSKDGYLSVFEVGKAKREKESNQITLIRTPPNKQLQFSLSSKEIYLNYHNNVVILDSLNMKFLYSLQAHDKEVTKIQLFDSIGLLMTAGKDNAVKFWQFKYLPHLTMNTQIMPFRKEPPLQQRQQIREKPEIQKEEQQAKMKPELEDLDHWQ